MTSLIKWIYFENLHLVMALWLTTRIKIGQRLHRISADVLFDTFEIRYQKCYIFFFALFYVHYSEINSSLSFVSIIKILYFIEVCRTYMNTHTAHITETIKKMGTMQSFPFNTNKSLRNEPCGKCALVFRR